MGESDKPNGQEQQPRPQQDQEPSSESLPIEPFKTEWIEKGGGPPSRPLPRPPAEKRDQ
jgi:hypothetical protein